jgi:hypothetical protein
MCDFTHLLASIQDAMDSDLPDNVDFLVQEKCTEQEKKRSIEPDDGYCMDYGHDKNA